jgi:hypothetical protein
MSKPKLLFNAVHESIFNSIFPWANINNHPMTAIEEVYKDFQLRTLVDGSLYQYLGQDDQDKPQYSQPLPYNPKTNPVAIRGTYQSERELPARQPVGSYFLVGGDYVHEQWVMYLLHNILEPIGVELKKSILRLAGTRRKNDWHFDYVSNGIFYTMMSNKASVIQVTRHEPSEHELVNQAVLNQQMGPKRNLSLSESQLLAQALEQLSKGTTPVPARKELKFNVDIRQFSGEDRFDEVYQNAVALLLDPKSQGAKLIIVVAYAVEGYFNKLVNFINHFIETQKLDIVVKFEGVWEAPIITTIPVVDQRMQAVIDGMNATHDKLREIRQLIVKANHISAFQHNELQQIAPQLYQTKINVQDMAEIANAEDPTALFYGKDPMVIDQDVMMMCLAIDRYLDAGKLPPVVQQRPMQDIPIAAVNMNQLQCQELESKIARINPGDALYTPLLNKLMALRAGHAR